ncbi:MAG: FAD-dependent oxidoreductase [Anaerolineae bacterium]|nr:FAD-dependent oxidoreductase [Anaerolineae bacterium]
MEQVIIVGGGVAGLTCAVHLAERGLRPLLIEANPVWMGGRLADTPEVQLEHRGRTWFFPGEHGVHGIWSPYVNLKAMLERLDIAPAYLPAQDETWIFGQGARVRKAHIGRAIRSSWWPAPFHYLSLLGRPRFLAMINLRDIASMFRVLGGLFSAMAIDPLAEQKAISHLSLAEFTKGWSPTLRALFAGLARNALAAHPEQVPAAGFITFLRFYTLMRRDAWAFAYLPSGGGRAISEPLAEQARQRGADIWPGAEVVKLMPMPDGAGWWVTVEEDDRRQTLETRDLVLAVSSPAAQGLLEPLVMSREQLAVSSGQSGVGSQQYPVSPLHSPISNLHFPTGVPTAIIRAWFDGRPQGVSEAGIFSGDFVMDNFFWLDRLQDEFREWAQMTGGSALEVHIYGPPELLAEPDALLLARVLRDINRAFPELRGRHLKINLQRNEATHTLFSVGEPGRHLGVVTPWEGLYLCGDWVYHPAPAMYLERAVVTGMAAANELLTRHKLEPFALRPHPEPEPLAGWLARQWGKLYRRLDRRYGSGG